MDEQKGEKQKLDAKCIEIHNMAISALEVIDSMNTLVCNIVVKCKIYYIKVEQLEGA